MDVTLFAVFVLSLLLAFLLWLRPSPKPPTLEEAFEVVQQHGLTFDPEATAQMPALDLPAEAGPRQAWLRNPELSLKYFQSSKYGQVLETLDFIFTDRRGAGGIVIHYVGGQPGTWKHSGREMPPMDSLQASYARRLLKAARNAVALPT